MVFFLLQSGCPLKRTYPDYSGGLCPFDKGQKPTDKAKEPQFCGFFVYNEGMIYASFITDSFWGIMEALVPLVVPVVGVALVFRLVFSIMFKDR